MTSNKTKGKQNNKRMKLTTTTMAVIMGMAAGIAQADTFPEGKIIESKVSWTDAVVIPNNGVVTVASIQVDCGYWEVSGLVNLYEEHGQEYFYAAANVSETTGFSLLDGSTSVQSVAPVFRVNHILGLSIPTRVLLIAGDGLHTVNLLAWNLGTESPVNSHAWGLIHAVKVDECHEVP
jgi:hypothetical protein